MSQKFSFGSPCHKYNMAASDNRTFWKNIHYFSGITLAIFIGFHLLNHLLSLGGPILHVAWMGGFAQFTVIPLSRHFFALPC
jgi:hypothetical protein